MSSFARLKRRIPIIATMALSGTLVVALSAPQIASAAGRPSVDLVDIASVSTSQAAVRPLEQGESSKKAIRGDQSPDGRNTAPGGGNYSVTSLTPSATWQVSNQTGDFSWTYPIPVTSAPGGVVPSLGLSYSSSAVDGLTSATNNQASWIGDGWSLWPGFVERNYNSCSRDVDDTPDDNPADQCWGSDNATMSLNGSGTTLIGTDGTWRPKSDDGSKVERIGNPHDRNESWKVTTTDGTQYSFGSRAESKSAWKVPVFGDDAGEPCNNGGYATSWCDQTYRWNLDKVVSRTGDMMIYNYETERNSYGRNKSTAVSSYDRGGWLTSIDYGLRADRELPASGRVLFEVAERCLPNSDCAKPVNQPDVPLDLKCEDNVCKDKWSPSFWLTKRLTKITTQGRDGADFRPVDSWTLRHEWPEPGDGERPTMWLAAINHTGHTGATAITLPDATFEGVPKPNRVYTSDGYSKLIRYRMNAIVSETGGVTGVNYAEPECTFETKPAKPETNTMLCYPAKWAAPRSPERTDYFHKYVVSQVTSLDRIGSSVADTTSYVYPARAAAWHYDESEFTPDKDKTWNSYRGFGTVTVLKGTGHDGPKTKTTQTYYRGMHGDHLPKDTVDVPKLPDGTRDVQVRDSEGGSQNDDNWLRGQTRESITYLGETADVVSKTISEPYFRGPTATRGQYKAYIVRPGTTRVITPLKAGGRQETRTRNIYEPNDPTGSVSAVDDLGDTSTAADDRCVRTWYDRRPGQWLMNLAARVETVAVNCDTAPAFPAHALSDTLTRYDAAGNPDELKQLKAHPAAGPEYVTTVSSRYDVHGRPVEVTNAAGAKSTSAFSPEVGGPVTGSVTTDAKGFTTRSTLDGLRGGVLKVVDANQRLSESAYDALGRLIETWAPDRSRARKERGNTIVEYSISRDAPNAVTTKSLAPRGNHITTTQIYDGLLRPRQTQRPTQGGRLLTDIRYDSLGRAVQATQPFYNDKPVDTKFWVANNTEPIPTHTVTEFDGAGRSIAEIYKAPTEQWRSSTKYGGDRVEFVPPPGGTPSITVTNARGQTTAKLMQSAPGVFDTTAYTHHPSGQLAEVTDPAGNKWKYTFNLLGHSIRQEDPDKGHTTAEYNELGLVTGTTDARGKTLTREYDVLGRQTSVSQGGVRLAEWTYDTAAGGKGLAATTTRWADRPGGVRSAYITEVSQYDAGGRPEITKVVVPASEGGLAGTYTNQATYGPDGTLVGADMPGIGTALPYETITYSHDDLGRQTTTTSSLEGQTDYVSQTLYSRLGEAERLQLGETGKRAWLSYYYEDKTRRLKRSIVDTETPSPMQTDVNYTYNPFGTVTSISDRPVGKTADLQCFRYDGLVRLVEAWTPTGDCAADPDPTKLSGPAPYWQSFGYDKVGNRLKDILRTTVGATTRTYDYPTAGHTQKSVTIAKSGGGTTFDQFTYDASGNSIIRNLGGSDQKLDWDAEEHLTKVTKDGKETEFLYSADGVRLIRRDPAANVLYLGNQEVRVDKATGVKTATRYYSHGGAMVAMRSGGALTWLASDHQGTNQVAMNTTDLTVSSRRQLPFGAPRGEEKPFPGERGFVGGIIDPSVGLTNLGARQYDPTTGRFISVDPLLAPGNSQQMHGYTYANNNPITDSDPSGLMPNRMCPDGGCPKSGGGGGSSGTTDGSKQPTGNQPTGNGPFNSGTGCGARACPTKYFDPNTVNNGCGARACKMGTVDPDNVNFEPAKVVIPQNTCTHYAMGTGGSGPCREKTPVPKDSPFYCEGTFNCVWEAGWRTTMAMNPITMVPQMVADLSGYNTSPDYIVLDGVLALLPGPTVGPTGGLTVSSHGLVTYSRGVSVGAGSGVGARLGWLQNRKADKDEANGFIQGAAAGIYGSAPLPGAPVGISAGGVKSSGKYAGEYGLSWPGGWGASYSASNSTKLFDMGG